MSETEERPRKMIDIDGVLEIVPVGRTTIYRMMEKKSFPASVQLTAQRRAWFEDEVVAWQKALEPRRRVRRRVSVRQPA